jgi:hypothetical protein
MNIGLPPGIKKLLVLGYLQSDTNVHFLGYFYMQMEEITPLKNVTDSADDEGINIIIMFHYCLASSVPIHN